MTNFKKSLYFYRGTQDLACISKYSTFFKSCIHNILAYSTYSFYIRTKINFSVNNTIEGVTYIYEEKR